MFKTIIAGSDGQRGRGAASLAQVIATATGARLLLVGVEHELPLALIETHSQVRAATERALRGVRDRHAPDADIQIAVDASPAHALRRMATDEHADLIVVGSRTRGPIERLTSSDDAMQVLHGAPCAVAIAPDHLAPCHRLGRIGVGIDSTPESGAALDVALELARRSGAALRLLAVAHDVYPGSPEFPADVPYDDIYREVLESRSQAARVAVAAALKKCSGVPVSADVQLGDPATALTALGTECDLLVLGSRRWGPLRRLALGSTSERVIRHAACPVLVPPRGAAEEHGDTQHMASTTAC